MLRKIQTRIALALILSLTGFAYASAQQKAQTLFTGAFHGKVRNTSGRTTKGCHFFPEENPDDTATILTRFLTA
jgi:hypothetical protein